MLRRRRPADAPTLSDRAAPLIEEAAERSRVSWRTRVERLRLAWRSIFQASVSAALAWLIATKVLGHPQPFFAPVSAIITLGITVGQRGQRAAEVALGVALGIAVADLLVLQIGTGTAQLALVVALASRPHVPRQRADVRHPGGGLGRARGDAAAAHATASRSPASSTRWSAAASRWLVNALVLPARPLRPDARAPRRRCWTSWRRRSRTSRSRVERPRPRGSRSPRWSAPARSTSSARASRTAGRRGPRDHALRARRAGGRAGRSRATPSRGADRPRRPQRARAGPRRRSRALVARRERPAGDRATRCASSPRPCARWRARSRTRTALDDVREPALRAAAEATQVLEATGNLSVSVIVGPDPLDRRRPARRHRDELRGVDGRRARRRPRGRGRALTELGWEQVRAWRLARHGLAERAPAGELLAVASRLCGVHAQCGLGRADAVGAHRRA